MKKYSFIFLTVCAAMVSCQKSQETVNFVKGQKVTLNITNEAATKATGTFDAVDSVIKFTWTTGDAIKVTVGTKSAQFTLVGEGGSESGSFEGYMPADGTVFDVQYPYAGLEESALAAQTYSSTLAVPQDMMLATATGCTVDNSFTLVPQYSVLRLNLWGEYTLGKIVVTNADATASTYTLDCGSGVALGATEAAATPFNLVVPSGSWKFKAEFFDTASALITSFTTTNAQTFTAGAVLDMPAKKVAAGYPGSDMDPVEIGGVMWAPVNCGYDATANPYGLYYQWGRKYGQIYQNYSAVSLSKAEGQLESNADKLGAYWNDNNWFSGGVDNTLWGGSTKSTYDPCPAGWRVPNNTEMQVLVDAAQQWVINKDITGKATGPYQGMLFENKLFFQAAGYISYDLGTAANKDLYGDYWTTSTDNNNAYRLVLYYGTGPVGYLEANYRAWAFSVRCVQE